MADSKEPEVLNKENEQIAFQKIQEDLNLKFPFSALWQDEEAPGGLIKLIPIISMVIELIMLVLVIILLTKI